MGNVIGREEEEEEEEEEENGGGDDEEPSARSSERGFAPHHARREPSAESIGGGESPPPRSPRRSPSPFMFAPQIPVPPLQRYVDTPQLPNQLSTNERRGSPKDPAEKKIPVLLVWTLGGKKVHVEGSWDNWTEKLSLERSGKDHSVLMSLPSGIYRYRFIVDGERRFIPDFPYITDEMGNSVNFLDVDDYVPDNVAGVSEFDHPPSPDSSYSWQEPSDQDFAKEPPALPPQLHLTVLDLENSEAAATVKKPHHVLLNHLFIEKPGGPQPLVGLGFTHRFQSKYVTVVLYKPME